MSAAPATQLGALLDESACRSLVEWYPYALDWLNWSGLEALFWEDATFDFGVWQGDRAAFLPWVTALEEPFVRRLHMFAAPRIELVGAAEARIEAGAMIHTRSTASDDAADEVGTDTNLLVRYQFRASKRGEEWRLSELRCIPYGSQSFAGDGAGSADGLTTTNAWFAQ